MQVTVLVGNPKVGSRTLAAAAALAEKIGDGPPAAVVDLATFGGAVLEWGNPQVAEAVDAVQSAEVVVVASPTFKATYTGLLKAFLDQIPTDGLATSVAIPLMLGAGPAHALAPELLLKPVLVELGATCPTKGLYVVDVDHDRPDAFDSWLVRAKPAIAAATAGLRGADA